MKRVLKSARTILFYNDVQKDVDRVVSALRGAGVRVDLVERFGEARHRVLTEKYDAVVFDLRLEKEPGMDGFQFLRAVYDPRSPTEYIVFSRWVESYRGEVQRAIREGLVAKCFLNSQAKDLLEYLKKQLGLSPKKRPRAPSPWSLVKSAAGMAAAAIRTPKRAEPKMVLREKFEGEVTRVIGDDVEVIFDVEGDTVEHVYHRDQLEGGRLPAVGNKVTAVSFLFTRPAPPLDPSELKEALGDEYPAIRKRIDRRKVIEPED